MNVTTTTQAWPSFAGLEPIEALVQLSRFYGSNPSFVLAGGGNTSVKVGDKLYVKASGTALATISADGFAVMDRQRLTELAASDLGSDAQAREVRYKEAILAARLEPAKGQRPSVEVLLHHLTPGRFVVHSHATVVNAVTCCAKGPELAKELFGDDVLWLPYVDPGYTLARSLAAALVDYRKRTGRSGPQAILMANHGLLVGGDEPEQVRDFTDRILEKISDRLGTGWQSGAFGPMQVVSDASAMVNVIGPALRGLLAEGAALKVVTFDDSDVAMSLAGSARGQAIVAGGPMTPDQIVYCNSFPLWFSPVAGEKPAATVQRLREALAAHQKTTGFAPKAVLVAGVGLFAIGDTWAAADTTRAVYLDAVAVMAGATKLGGVSYFTTAQRTFIEQWEVEAYRKQVAKAAMGGKPGRVAGKIAIVTGAAQGVGLEIARYFVGEGGTVILADINVQGTQAQAETICREFGRGRAIGVAANVADGASVQKAISQVVRMYGGFDVLVSNAGVLRAESVKTQSEKDFDFVTAVNYKGYFVCTQKAAAVLSVQHLACPEYRSDIIQINSKSGLQGSNKNGAYAGSKFGSIGLTQSFAMELVEDGVKVNAICPGNFFDLPLWSDPENGLFMQYLRAGKVPGAKTVADIRRAYELKVPMGRGCLVSDVMKAIYYLMEQQYETGQALPVTGGQVMLK